MNCYRRYAPSISQRLASFSTLRLAAAPCSWASTSITSGTAAAASTSSLSLFSHNNNSITIRHKHSSRQIKRLFKNNPAKRRIENNKKERTSAEEDNAAIPQAQFVGAEDIPPCLPNGWNPPLLQQSSSSSLEDYPFGVTRTKNKPNNAVGFLPVYSEFRKDGARTTTRIKKVSGDRQAFLNELRAALQIPIPHNPKEDTVRVRTGGTIEVKGNRVREVKQWLAGLGF